MDKKRRKEKREKKRKNEGKQKEGVKEKKSDRKRERERGEKNKREIFSAFRWSKLNGLRRIVDPHIESYAWVPKF